jgi:hypothetical protein
METEGWAPLSPPSPNGKLHYYDKTGKSLCNRWLYLGQEMVDRRPQWQNFEENEVNWKNILDPEFCMECQLKYEGGGRQKPGYPGIKCEGCGRFGARFSRFEWNWAYEGVDEVYLCKECDR